MIVSIPKELCIKSVKDATTIKIIPQKDVISETIVEYVRFVMFRKYKVIYKIAGTKMIALNLCNFQCNIAIIYTF
jgi:hypothetical protein